MRMSAWLDEQLFLPSGAFQEFGDMDFWVHGSLDDLIFVLQHLLQLLSVASATFQDVVIDRAGAVLTLTFFGRTTIHSTYCHR